MFNFYQKLENDLTDVFYKNEMLSKELTGVLDIKEKTDKQLIEANKKAVEVETYKKKTIALLVFTRQFNPTLQTINNLFIFLINRFRLNQKLKIKQLKHSNINMELQKQF